MSCGVADEHEHLTSSLLHLLQSISLSDKDEEVLADRADDAASQPLSATSTSVRQQQKSAKPPARALPSLHSAEWETENLPPPPKAARR